MKVSVAQAQAFLSTALGIPMPGWTPYLALFVGDPFAGGVEVIGGSYARQPVPFGGPSGNRITNYAPVAFPTPTGTWGSPVTHMGFADAPTGGSIRHAELLPGTVQDRTIIAGTPVMFDTGSIGLNVPGAA